MVRSLAVPTFGTAFLFSSTLPPNTYRLPFDVAFLALVACFIYGNLHELNAKPRLAVDRPMYL